MNLVTSFTLQSLEGATNSVVGLSQSGSYTVTGYTNDSSETIVVAPNTTNQQIQFPVFSSSVFVVENTGTVPLTISINATSGTQFSIFAGGFFLFTGNTTVTSLYVNNASATTAGNIKVFLGG